MEGALSELPDDPVPLHTALALLRSLEVELRGAGVAHAAIFGSVARGDAVPGSDVDMLVDLDPEAHVSLFELVGIEMRLAQAFERKVDVLTRGGLRPGLDDGIAADAIEAF